MLVQRSAGQLTTPDALNQMMCGVVATGAHLMINDAERLKVRV